MKVDKNNSITTVLAISIGFSIVYFLFDIKVALYISLIVGVIGLLSKKAADLIDVLWMRLAMLLSYIVPNILLSLIFYLLLFPLAFFYKIFVSKDPLKLKNSGETIWKNKDIEFNKSSFEKMW